jgi:Zn2+/Cd2+-exporting ATPase
LLVKGARHFEEGRRIDTVVFDKTGTLTEGVLHVEQVWTYHAVVGREDALAWATALERHSNHPVARAIQRAADGSRDALTVEGLKEHSGRGVEGRVGTSRVLVGRLRWLASEGITLAAAPSGAETFSLVGIAVEGQHVATIGLADRVRPEAAEAIARLRAVGVERFVVLTGDRESVAQAVASRLGLTEVVAECLPEDKQKRIEALKATGAHVMVVGDGLNDAPALAAGNLGVAMGALGNDVAIATADVALMNNDLRRLADLLELSHRTVGTINQNLLCGFAFILIAITLSALGYIPPVLAAFVHEFSAFFVIFNSARLLRFDGLEAVAETPAAEPVAAPKLSPA